MDVLSVRENKILEMSRESIELQETTANLQK